MSERKIEEKDVLEKLEKIERKIDEMGRTIGELRRSVEELNYRVGLHDLVLRNIGNPFLGDPDRHSFVDYPESLWNSITRPDHR